LYADYKQRSYFWGELGGLLFLDGRFSTAARFYERAYTLEPSDDIGCLLADAALFAGKYELAAGLFKKHARGEPEHAEWRVKGFAATLLVDGMSLGIQRRDPVAAASIMAEGYESTECCLRALQLDALYALAWFNLGVTAAGLGRREEALRDFLLSAAISNVDWEAWCNVVILSAGLGNTTLFTDAILVGHFFGADAFLTELHARVLSKAGGIGDESVVTSIAEAIDDARRRPDVRLRFHLAGGGYEEVSLDADK
jgi:tetratricopeptide (TPR) repeat protein